MQTERERARAREKERERERAGEREDGMMEGRARAPARIIAQASAPRKLSFTK